MKYLLVSLAALSIILLFPCELRAQGISFDDDEEESYKIDREELIELILEVAGEEADIFCGRWLRVPVVKIDTSEAAARIARIMETRRISVSFQDTGLAEAFAFIADMTGINIVLSPGLAEGDETITLKLRDAKVTNVINLICDVIGGISWTFKNEVLYVGTEDEIKNEVTKEFILIDLGEFLISPPDFKGPDIKIFDPEGS